MEPKERERKRFVEYLTCLKESKGNFISGCYTHFLTLSSALFLLFTLLKK